MVQSFQVFSSIRNKMRYTSESTPANNTYAKNTNGAVTSPATTEPPPDDRLVGRPF